MEANVTEMMTTNEDDDKQGINVVGLVSLIVFYSLVLAVGIWAAVKQGRSSSSNKKCSCLGDDQETAMLAGRNIGLFVGILTMGATWVGGGFINGTAEATYSQGVVWTIAPFGYSIALVISGTFFAKKMRDSRYVTMIDPFTQKYGKWGALQALPAALGEIFWSASILSALGSTLEVIMRIDTQSAIISSSIIAVCYTLVGGLISVAYTDVFQLFFIAFGLFLALPFAWTNPLVDRSLDTEKYDWIGTVPSYKAGEWLDLVLLTIFGGVPWQCYFQRVLSCTSSKRAVLMSYGGAAIAISMTIPCILFGAIGASTDWNQTAYGQVPSYSQNDAKLILPLCLQYLTPSWVTFFGLGAISAAVMSSSDSSMLSASTMIARNVYKAVFRPHAREKEVLLALTILIIINGIISTMLAITYESVYDMLVLCGDAVFVLVFPQLLLILYCDKVNTYGSVTSFFLGLVLRLLCGEAFLGIPSVINIQLISEVSSDGQLLLGPVPYRTIVMLIGLLCHLIVSYTTHFLFTSGILDLKFDVLSCFKSSSSGLIVVSSHRHLAEEFAINEAFDKS